MPNDKVCDHIAGHVMRVCIEEKCKCCGQIISRRALEEIVEHG